MDMGHENDFMYYWIAYKSQFSFYEVLPDVKSSVT